MKLAIVRCFLVEWLLVALATPVVLAQELVAEPARVPAALEEFYRKTTEESLREVPVRDVKINAGPPERVKIFRDDLKRLLENKFVATFTPPSTPLELQASQRLSEPRARMLNEINRTLPEAQQVPDLDIVLHRLQVLAKRCPPEQRPEKNLVEYLTSEEHIWNLEPDPSGTGWRYAIYAPTAKEAETRASAMLQLFDAGFFRPNQRFFLAEGRKSLGSAHKGYDELTKLNADIRAESEKLAKPSEISPDILSQLKAQKVMIAIELAGLSARVRACDEMLKELRKIEVSTLQSVSDMKVKAEIERVGIKEKLDQINMFIGEGDKRLTSEMRRFELSAKQEVLRGRILQHEGSAEDYARLVELYAPLQLKDNEIVVSPVEWTN